MKVVLLLSALCAVIAAEYVSYEGFKVYQIHPKNEAHLEFIASFAGNEDFDFWERSKILGLPATVMVHPSSQESFTQALDHHKIPHNILIENVNKAIGAERQSQNQAPKTRNGRISFTQYYRYADIQAYLAELAENYPDIVELEFFQTTYYSNELEVIKIGQAGTDRPIIFIECGIHAREWIAPATCLYIIQELVENEDNRNMIENLNWYLVPVLNPDGYEYTHTNERLWRKTRKPNEGSTCIGVDGNRNFGYHWGEQGASTNPCSETFAGSAAFDQLETLGLSNLASRYEDQIKLFLTIHSYGQYILYPWGFTGDYSENVEEQRALAVQMDDAIAAVNGTRYTIGSSYNVLYASSGSSRDWFAGALGVAFSYTVELPGGGQYGFDLPASRILGVVTETFEGIKAAHSFIENKYVSKVVS